MAGFEENASPALDLGCNVMGLASTVAKLVELGVRAHCLALGRVDLTSSTGKLTMNVLNAVAEFQRDLLVIYLHLERRARRWAGPSYVRRSVFSDAGWSTPATTCPLAIYAMQHKLCDAASSVVYRCCSPPWAFPP